ncbi:MAG: NAD(P)H-dependent oxidoreductase [Eggerthellaceae bacterium]|nr:NAD(P)H-dependent oxidoreductase [Eggerthellaceae bacterium]
MKTTNKGSAYMNNLIVFDHPYGTQASEDEPHNRSFCAALCKSVVNMLQARGEKVIVLDLQAEGFDPVMSAEELALWRKGIPVNKQVASYQQCVREADRLIFVFPIWWELMPAMTKGFIDKVYAKDVLYKQEKGLLGMKTLIPNCEVILMTPLGTPTLLYKLIFGKPVVNAIQRGLCMKTGIKKFRWLAYSNMDALSFEQRQKLLSSIRI